MSVHKQPNGTYKCHWREGTKQRAKSGFKRKSDATRYLALQKQRYINTGSITSPSKITVEESFEQMLLFKSLADKTEHDYRSIFNHNIKKRWGRYPVSKISKTDIAIWIKALQSKYAKSSVDKIVAVFSSIFSWAIVEDLISSNPVTSVKRQANYKRLPSPKKQKTLLTHKQISTLLTNLDSQYKLFVELACYTGLRFGEISSLQKLDLDLANSRLKVSRAACDVAGVISYKSTKNGKTRIVPFPKHLVHELENLTLRKKPSDLLFTTSEGAPIRNGNFTKRHLIPAAQIIGMPELRFHQFRHTYAALAISAGANPYVLKDILGHSDIRVTMDVYGGSLLNDMAKLSDTLVPPKQI